MIRAWFYLLFNVVKLTAIRTCIRVATNSTDWKKLALCQRKTKLLYSVPCDGHKPAWADPSKLEIFLFAVITQP